MIVGPAMAAAHRRPPERLAEDAADHATGYGAYRTGDKEAGSGAGAGADPVGARFRRGNHRDSRKRSCRQQKLFHLVRPPTLLAGCTTYDFASRPVKSESLTNSWQSSGGFEAAWSGMTFLRVVIPL
jgi:hypothetical protein